jgi:hypothetical protein
MTDYNDGNWHEWNGGECPVHPESVIEGYWHFPSTGKIGRNIGKVSGGGIPAHEIGWVLRLFRVVTPYREPREWWLRIDRNGEVSGSDTEKTPPPNWGKNGDTIIKVREVRE